MDGCTLRSSSENILESISLATLISYTEPNEGRICYDKNIYRFCNRRMHLSGADFRRHKRMDFLMLDGNGMGYSTKIGAPFTIGTRSRFKQSKCKSCQAQCNANDKRCKDQCFRQFRNSC